MKRILPVLAALLPVIVLFGQNFSEVAVASGVNISYGQGLYGGGVSFADFDNDGDDDLTFTSASGLPVYFYRNNGNGSFTSLNLINNTGDSKEAIWVDYDNDGDQDLFLSVFNEFIHLYQNDGNLNLTEVSNTAFGNQVNRKNYGAAWGDYDNDGWLDVYVCEYIGSGTTTNRLFRNNGNGTFTDVSAGTPANDGVKLSFDACFFDCNNDNWPDIYVSNDRYVFANALFVNQLGSYSAAPGNGADISIDAMNAGGADYDNDGDLDLYVSNTSQGNQLLQNNGLGSFVDVAGPTGTVVNQVTWASNFFDYDNDLDQDLYVSSVDITNTGHANAFLVNEGDGTFSNNLAATGGLGGVDTGESYGHAMGDINNDGKLDIAVSQVVDNNLLWRNDETAVGNYLKIRLTGTTSNRDGIGARIVAQVGGHVLTRYRHGSLGYLSQHSQSIHFGLGSNTTIDELYVYWPSGIVDQYSNLTSINQIIGLTEGETVLPLVLTDFQAEAAKGQNLLTWETSQEKNTSHFGVERSADGKSFHSIGRVAAKGDSEVKQDYEFVDANPVGERLYYRLKMTDIDGSFEYSQLRMVARELGEERKFSRLRTNPTQHSDITVILSNELSKGNYQLRLYDAKGHLVRQAKVEAVNEGDVRYTFAGGLSAGAYSLEVSGMGRRESHRVVVQ